MIFGQPEQQEQPQPRRETLRPGLHETGPVRADPIAHSAAPGRGALTTDDPSETMGRCKVTGPTR